MYYAVLLFQGVGNGILVDMKAMIAILGR